MVHNAAMKGIFLLIAGCSLAGMVVGASPSAALAVEPAIRRLDIAEDGRSVLVSLALAADLGDLNREALDGGIPFSYRYRMRLLRSGGLLGEKLVADKEIVHTLQFDPARKAYRFTAEGYPGKVERETAQREEALAWMDTVEGVPLHPLAGLVPGKRYRVRAMATLRSAELPTMLGYLFFFTSLLDQETSWREKDFVWR
jgi:hypothetical protein